MTGQGGPQHVGDSVGAHATAERTVRVLVCGSRTYRDTWSVNAVLDGIHASLGGGEHGTLVVIHGAAHGADSIAAGWAAQTGVESRAFPADWATHGRKAGFLRNRQMLVEGKPDVVWAFVDKPLAESKGTAMMVDLARKAIVPTYVVEVSEVGDSK